jgi:ArsR family transcriptional regulator, arsenate/arsenite/antimonite-responsive transcriptional repressor
MYPKVIFSALSDPNRLKIIDALKQRDLSVTELNTYIPVTMATLSHHLDILKHTDMVTSRRNGQQIIYSLNLSVIEEISEAIVKILTVRRKL